MQSLSFLCYIRLMKKHAIIPIFIPHRGCPNDCVFCNQRKITAKTDDVTPEDVERIITEYLATLEGRGLDTIEVAFFGGSFTGIPMEEQAAFLAVAHKYKMAGKVDAIHLSTRPDYINREILDQLRHYSVDVIELGVQSFDENVLKASRRGHDVAAVENASALIHEYGFTLGIQLMIGLPGDSLKTCVESAKAAVRLKPAIARLYPTVVIDGTELADMYRSGAYRALSTKEAVEITAQMYRILVSAGVQVIRVGLKNTDLISDGGPHSAVLADYHPSFRQLMESRIAREELEAQLQGLASGDQPAYVTCYSMPRLVSAMSGYQGCNRKYFLEKYPNVHLEFCEDAALGELEFKVEIRTPDNQ